MVDYGRLLDRGVTVAADHPLLAGVPLATSLLAVDNVRAVAGFHGSHVGVKFPFPTALLDVWSFVSLPNQGLADTPTAVALLPLFVLVRAVLVAGYLGCVRDALVGRPLQFAANVRRHLLPLAVFELLSVAAVLVLVPFASVGPAVLVLAIPALLVLGYLFYGTPYLVVVADESLLEALAHSYALATDGGPYFGFFARFLAGGAALSVPVTAVVVNGGPDGVALGAVALAPVGLVLTATTTALVLELVDVE